jgi:polyphosphate kinase
MQRNFDRRVEIAFPILEPALQSRLKDILEIQLADNVKGWWMQPDGNYLCPRDDGEPVRSQEQLYKFIAAQPEPSRSAGFRLGAWRSFG